MSVKRFEWIACDEHSCHCDVVESVEGDMVDYEDYAALEQQLAESQSKLAQMAAENSYLLSGAARELNTSWMFHKTMLGAQAALVCISRGDIKATRDWLEGTTDEAGADIPDEITVAELQPWFDSQMVSNDGKSGFLTREEAEEAIKSRIPATDSFLAEVRAQGVEMAAKSEQFSTWVQQGLRSFAIGVRQGDDQ